MESATPDTIYIAADDFAGTNEGGALLQWTTTYNNCSTLTGNNMPAGWNDRVQSVHTYSGCASTVFENTNYGQPEYAIGVDAQVNSLGTLNQKGSAQSFCSYYGCTG